MRAVVVLAALVATPFLASAAQSPTGAAQGRGHDAAHCAARADRHPDKTINKCPEPAPAPPPAPACGNGVMSGGSASIDGWVYLNGAIRPGACVSISGPVSGTATADAFGKYAFTGLPAGTYLVCELQPEVLSGTWRQTYPSGGASCATGFGYVYTLGDGSRFAFTSFMFVTP